MFLHESVNRTSYLGSILDNDVYMLHSKQSLVTVSIKVLSSSEKLPYFIYFPTNQLISHETRNFAYSCLHRRNLFPKQTFRTARLKTHLRESHEKVNCVSVSGQTVVHFEKWKSAMSNPIPPLHCDRVTRDLVSVMNPFFTPGKIDGKKPYEKSSHHPSVVVCDVNRWRLFRRWRLFWNLWNKQKAGEMLGKCYAIFGREAYLVLLCVVRRVTRGMCKICIHSTSHCASLSLWCNARLIEEKKVVFGYF